MLTALIWRRSEKSASSFATIAGVEAGTWVLARAGLLNGYQATTHWEDFEAFASRFPDVELKQDRFVTDRNRLTCGGASPAFDMTLAYIRQCHGNTIAAEIASVFIYEQARSQYDAQPVFSLGRLDIRDRRLEQAVRLMESSVEKPVFYKYDCPSAWGFRAKHWKRFSNVIWERRPAAFFSICA